MLQQYKTVRPDAKGRISLGILSRDISGFKMIVDEHHRIILEPLSEIPFREKWLFANSEALSQVQQGIKDAAQGKIKKKDFSAYLNDESQ